MASQLSTAARNAALSALVTLAGAGCKLKLYNGARSLSPAGTLLATAVYVTALGSVSGGVLSLGAVGSTTQNSALNVAGTPTFALITDASDTPIYAIDIGSGAGNLAFVGAVASGQSLTLSGLTITAGNA